MSDKDRIQARMERLINLREKLIGMLEGGAPSYIQRQILSNISDRIMDMQVEIKIIDESEKNDD